MSCRRPRTPVVRTFPRSWTICKPTSKRRSSSKFKTVLDDMQKQDVVGGLRQIADEMPSEPALSIAKCEFWWDTMDRWAEDLVDPAGSGSCQCSGSKDSLPPAIVLEVLKNPRSRDQSARRDSRGRAGPARPGQGRVWQAQPAGFPKRRTAWITRQGCDRAYPRIASMPTAVRQGDPIAWRGSRSDGRRNANPRPPEHGRSGDRRRDRSDRTSLESRRRINPKGGGGGGSIARRRWRRHDQRFGAGASRHRRQCQGSSRSWHGNPSRRYFRAGRCPKSSAPAWTNTLASWKIGRRVSVPDTRR